MTETTAVAVVHQQWNRDQIDLLKATVAEGTTDLEFQLFAQVCQRTGLDPFARQIYAIKRKMQKDGRWVERMVLQTGIDGYRVIAERTGEYVGGDEPTYGGECPCGNKALGKHPEWAAVTVRRLKSGQGWTTTAKAYFDEYAQTKADGHPNGMWEKMPRNQLAKCAEALALRRAFPGLFEGVYTSEEMGQADNEAHAPVTAPAAPQDGKVVVVDAPRGDVICPCPKCGEPLAQRKSKKGEFVSCTSWKSREAPGCGFTADGMLADFAKGEAELGDAEIVPATPDRGEMVATGVCHACQARGLTAKSGKAVTWHTPSTGGPPVCTGFDPVTDEFVRHAMTVEGQESDELPVPF
jgi:phage recombination protein Bet